MAERADAAMLRGPDRKDRLLGLGTLAMLAVMLVALARGRAHWGEVPGPVWFHLGTIAVALVLTPVLLWRRRGDRRHRWLGYAWVAALVVTALDSFFIRQIRPGHLSPIHLLSALVLFAMFRLVSAARHQDHATHRSAVRGTVFGALLISGLLTLSGGRLLGTLLFGG